MSVYYAMGNSIYSKIVEDEHKYKFTTGNNIHKLFKYSNAKSIIKVEIPIDDENLKITYNGDNIMISNMMTIKNKYYLHDLKHINEVLKINKNTTLIIQNAAKNGNIEILNWLKNNGHDLNFSENAIFYASRNGYVEILNWFKNNNYQFKKFYANGVLWASVGGKINVLEWFKNIGHKFKNNKNAIIYASKYGHVQVLDWFKNYGYELNFSVDIIKNACLNGHIQVLEWFLKSGYEFKYDEDAINNACIHGHIKILEWFKNSGYEFKYNEDASMHACGDGHISVLKWFKNSKYKLKYDSDSFGCYIRNEITNFFVENVNIKKVIKWSSGKFINTLKIKTKNNYMKGYIKN